MSFGLYDLTVPAFQQSLGAIAGLLNKAEAFCAENKVAPAEIIQARLYEDMLPFAYQVAATVHHSVHALDGVRKGSFSPVQGALPQDFAGLKSLVADALAQLAAENKAEIDALEGRPMVFAMGSFKLNFTTQDFLQTFSLPNFYFHAATTYGILRSRGLKIGKVDFMGKMRATRG